jgi:hypothetical protein
MARVLGPYRVLWTTIESPPMQSVFLTISAELMDDFLLCFDPLFVELSGLPSPRQQSHQIQLLPNTTPMAV